jgi:GntR family transcriptional repressor for pyruvate dehydrogenase complex
MTQVKRVNRKRLYQQVADDIERRILDGTLVPGSRLPSEQEMADEYGVSRNVIREALKRMKEHGLVYIRTGSGTYISKPSTKPVSDALHRLLRHSNTTISIAHFYEIRRMLEPESARLAAERAHQEDIEAIQAAYDLMERSRNNSDTWSRADLQFHLAVTTAAHNPLIESVVDPLTEPLRELIAVGLNEPSGAQAGLEAHRSILEAIQNHNPQLAYQAMLDHLLDSEKRLSKIGFQLGE